MENNKLTNLKEEYIKFVKKCNENRNKTINLDYVFVNINNQTSNTLFIERSK